MKKFPYVLPILLLAIGFIAGFLVVVSNGNHMGVASAYDYGTTSLVGASPEQVGQFAQQYIEAQHGTPRDKSQVLIAKSIKPDELPEMELGCPLSFAAQQEPPLMLVIVKGDFKVSGPGISAVSNQANYMAYIFDLWSAQPVYLMTSQTGGAFRKALNDASLPVETGALPGICPTALPYDRKLNYGDTAPEADVSNTTPISPGTSELTPLVTVPAPNPTVMKP